MDLDAIRAHFLDYEQCTEGFPFGPDVLVFKVAGKMFGLISIDAVPPRINVKCDPDRALELRAQYAAVEPGYHMSKKHWNTVVLDGSVPDDLVRGWVDGSYSLVAEGLPKKVRDTLGL